MNNGRQLGFAVCGCDSGQGSVGIPAYKGHETIHPSQQEAQDELDKIAENVRGFYSVCRIVQQTEEAGVYEKCLVQTEKVKAIPVS